MAGVYIHIPFCRSFCSYCDFYSVTDCSETDALVEALTREAALRSGYLYNETVDTVYRGGRNTLSVERGPGRKDSCCSVEELQYRQ